MPEGYLITNRVRNLIVMGLALLLIGVCALNFYAGRSWINRPFAGFVVLENNLIPAVAMPGWEGLGHGVKFGDIVVAADGKRIDSGVELNAYVASKQPGDPISYTIDRKGAELTLEVPVATFGLRDYAFVYLVFIFLGVEFCVMGLIVFFLKPNMPGARAFLANGVLLGLTLVAVPGYVTSHANLAVIITLVTMPLVGPSFVLMGLNFPEVKKSQKYWLALSFGPGIIVVILYLISRSDVKSFIIADTMMLVVMSVNNALGSFLVVRSFATSKDQLTRQKAKIVVYGLTLTVLICTVFVIGTLVFKILGFFMFLPLSVAIFPAAIAYAILKDNLFDIDAFIRLSASYVLVSGFMLVLFFGLTTAISMVLQNFTGQSSQIAAVASTLSIVLIFRPLRLRFDRFLDQRFFREKYEYRDAIRKASNVLMGIVELEPLLGQILDTVVESIKIERGLMLLRDDESGDFYAIVSRGYLGGQTLARIEPGHPLAAQLESTHKAIQINDLDVSRESEADMESALASMQRMNVVLIVPVIYENRIVGMLCLGEKKSGAWYSSEDIDILQTMMIQTAVSIENARKVEELKKMVELETSYRELQRLDEMKDNFLHMVSHDLRTPMTGVVGYAEILHDKYGRLDADTAKSYLEIIMDEGDRLTRLINDLLDLQRFDAGKMSLDFQDLNLFDITRRATDSINAAAAKKNISIESSPTDEGVTIHGHGDRLMQVMTNLLSNALKFTPEGGRISVDAEKLFENGNSLVKISVSDNGPGIPEDMQPRIFSKFQQAHQETRSQNQGSGLGLALVHEIIEYHGGQVGLESTPGKGSVFYFTLKIKE